MARGGTSSSRSTMTRPRSEPVRFFQRLRRPIFPATNLPDAIVHLSLEEELAIGISTRIPSSRDGATLHILPEDDVTDADLSRLRFIPELEHLILYGVGDEAMRHSAHRHSIDWLVVSSERVTDASPAWNASASS